jgi:actin-related protein
MFQDLSTLVVDIGTQRSRIGYGGDDAPKLIPYSYVNSYDEAMHEEGKSLYHVGDKYLNM